MTKFKIGDKVRCVKVEGEDCKLDRIHGGGWILAREFIIDQITNARGRETCNSLDMPIYWMTAGGGVYEHALEIVHKKEVKTYGIVKFMESIVK